MNIMQVHMMDVSKTQLIGYDDESEDIGKILMDVCSALEEKKYNPISQIVGYILSGDPTYITNHKGVRSTILNVERDQLISFLLEFFFNYSR